MDDKEIQYSITSFINMLVALFLITYMVPEVVGTMGMSSDSMGMDQGMWSCGANSLITMFLDSNSFQHQVRT